MNRRPPFQLIQSCRPLVLVASGLFYPAISLGAVGPDLAIFTPGDNIINYSVYTTDTLTDSAIYLPNSSKLATGGLFGSAGNVTLKEAMSLRAPLITVGGNLTIAVNPDSVPKLSVGQNLTVASGTKMADTFQVGGNFTGNGPNVAIAMGAAVKGNFSLNFGPNSAAGELRLGGTYAGTGGVTFAAGTVVKMAAGAGGPTGPTVTYNTPYQAYMARPLKVGSSSLPGYATSIWDSLVGKTKPNLDLSGPGSAPEVATSWDVTSPKTAYYWKCSNAGLPAGSCHGDTLQPGYYGDLVLTGNSRALLLTEGFYSFKSIEMGGGTAIVAAQPTGGRTVLVSEGNIVTNAAAPFIGPDKARLATGYGSGPNQFLGGTMMLVSKANVLFNGSDTRLWATVSAPWGDIYYNSQLALFGQMFSKRFYAANHIDFSQGAFIPFRGTVPPFQPLTFKVQEKADPACSDPSGRPCHDTLLPIVIAYTTAYDAKAHWELIESSPRSATTGVDFKADTGTVFIKMGESMGTIKIRIFDDSSYEGPETFLVKFSNISGAACPDGNGLADTSIHSCVSTGTIVDDDLPPLVRIFADTALPEGDAGTHTVPFTVRLYDPAFPANPLAAKNAPELAVPFKWSTADASATLADNDYVAQTPKWDTIPSKGLTKAVTVTVKGDLRYENDEFFWAKVDSARNGTVSGTVSDSGWILNDDAKPTVTVKAATVQEPAKYGDTAWVTITLQMSAPSGLPTTVWYRTQDSTAHGTSDFAATSNDFLNTVGSTVIPTDSVTWTIRVAVFGDTLYEKTEQFKLAIDSLRNADAASPFGVVTIVDADSASAVSVLDATVREPSTGTAILRLPIHLDRPSGLPSSFVWSTADSTALQGFDYRLVAADTMRIPAFVRDTFLEVTILADSVAGEGDEYLKVKLGDLVDLSAGDLDGVGTIQDAQDGFHLVIDSVGPVAEADTVVHFLAHTDWIAAHPIQLVYRTDSGTAVPGMRYADTAGTATLPAGSRSVAIAVRLKVDSLWEPLEYFKLRLDSILGANAPVVTDSVGKSWIREPKELEFTFDSPDTSVREDSAGTVPVRLRLSQPASIPVVVRLPVQSSSTATWIADFGFKDLSGDTLTIPAGNRVWTFGVPVVPDTLEEDDEVATLGIAPLTTGIAGARDRWNLTILDDDHHLKVVILTPPDGLHTNKPDWPITWTIDGKTQPPSDTTFEKEGWNCVERSATDRFGRVYADTNCIWLDTTPPRIEVFKITGPNPHDHDVDTTWWGDWAKTRYGKDTIWYWVRDSILDSDGKAWHVWVDTQFTLTKFTTDGIHPTEVKYCDSVGNCAVDTGWIEMKLNLPNAVSGVYLDRNNDGRIDAVIVELSEVWNADFLPTFELPLPPEVRKDVPADSVHPFVKVDGTVDETRFLVPIEPPFRFGVTSFDSLQGIMWENWTTGEAHPDSFPIRDSVPPVIAKAVVIRVENYKDPDTLVVTPSEPVKLKGDDLFEIGTCPAGKSTCPDSELVWTKVPQEAVELQKDGTYKVLVPPGDSGSVRPGYKIRFLDGVSDILGNAIATGELEWATLVEGAPRPDLVRVSIDHGMATMTAEERDRDRQPGILIRATSGKVSGDSVSRQWWEPGRGYISDDDPTVRAVCPDMSFCNGPTLYINRPARMIIYIYDNAGTYVMSRTVDITQDDIDRMLPDQIDRLAIDLEWNHRTSEGKAVSSGVYLWRIVSYVKLEGKSSPVVNTKLFRLGIKIPLKGGIF